jgi:hypothetical protein
MAPSALFDRRIYRLIFAAAALYNTAFGLWAGFRPDAFFDQFSMDPPRYPAIWACLGMVVGLYGLAYAYSAWKLERAAPFIAIGLVGKLLGPIGWMLTVGAGEWPLRTLTLILFNDVIWWLPFALFLMEGTRLSRRIRAAAPVICAGVHLAAGVAMLVWLRPGTEIVSEVSQRVAYIGAHPLAWRIGWGLWIAAGASFLGLVAWWGARLPKVSVGLAAFCVAACGFACDVFGESLFIGWLPENISTLAPIATFLTGAVANGLYTIAGIILTLGTPALKGLPLVWTWAIWISGASLTLFTLAGVPIGIVLSTTALFTLFIPWTLWLGARFR